MNLQFSLSAFLFFLPEGVLLLSIIVLLGFGMIFGTPNKVSYHQKFYTGYDNSYFSASKLNHDQMGDPFEDTDIDEMDEVDEVYEVNYISPALQTMPVAKLSVIGLLCCLTTLINNPYSYAVGYGLKIDALGWGMSIALVIGAIACLVLSFHSYQRHGRYEFILIQLLSCIGMLSVIKSYSFLSLYLSLECQSLSFYMLATMHSRSEASAEAGLKYFILSAFSSAMLLLGMTLVYGCTGSHSYADLYCICEHFAIYESPMQIWLTLGLTCICVSLLFKLGAAPFHAWIADVYEGSATSITALFAICAKISALTAIIRLYGCQNMFFLLSSCALLS
jgi:NADH:ubiquinone oxidoreductase subunit 2 (subunit N)